MAKGKAHMDLTDPITLQFLNILNRFCNIDSQQRRQHNTWMEFLQK